MPRYLAGAASFSTGAGGMYTPGSIVITCTWTTRENGVLPVSICCRAVLAAAVELPRWSSNGELLVPRPPPCSGELRTWATAYTLQCYTLIFCESSWITTLRFRSSPKTGPGNWNEKVRRAYGYLRRRAPRACPWGVSPSHECPCLTSDLESGTQRKWSLLCLGPPGGAPHHLLAFNTKSKERMDSGTDLLRSGSGSCIGWISPSAGSPVPGIPLSASLPAVKRFGMRIFWIFMNLTYLYFYFLRK